MLVMDSTIGNWYLQQIKLVPYSTPCTGSIRTWFWPDTAKLPLELGCWMTGSPRKLLALWSDALTQSQSWLVWTQVSSTWHMWQLVLRGCWMYYKNKVSFSFQWKLHPYAIHTKYLNIWISELPVYLHHLRKELTLVPLFSCHGQ